MSPFERERALVIDETSNMKHYIKGELSTGGEAKIKIGESKVRN